MLRFPCSSRRSFLNSLKRCHEATQFTRLVPVIRSEDSELILLVFIRRVKQFLNNRSLGPFSQKSRKLFHTTAKQVISRRRKNENVCEMSKMKTARAKRAQLLFLTIKYANLWRPCCCRRRGCVSSLIMLNASTSHAPYLRALFLRQNSEGEGWFGTAHWTKEKAWIVQLIFCARQHLKPRSFWSSVGLPHSSCYGSAVWRLWM